MIEIGELRAELSRDLQDVLMNILQKKSKDPDYYILVHSRAYGTDIKTTVMTIAAPPKLKFIGTMCFKVDNKACTCHRLWSLPLDVPIDDRLRVDGVDEETAKSAQGMILRT